MAFLRGARTQNGLKTGWGGGRARGRGRTEGRTGLWLDRFWDLGCCQRMGSTLVDFGGVDRRGSTASLALFEFYFVVRGRRGADRLRNHRLWCAHAHCAILVVAP
eukprot:2675912-Pleurochrysis_carterae.AAC.1